MKYGSVCSGIEAASVAWEPLGWQPQFFSEIEPFPSAVLAHHWPEVPNLGDMTKHKEWPDAAIDVLVGGTPCQSFSVAGLRKGMADPRGNLALTYLAIADQYRPRWLVWENVPGVLSSNGGRDFGAFLGGLGKLGYGFAYRVLDAQYFGVAQRRRRVFVVGYLGDWRPPAAVLFERHSLSGHPAPSREAREETAGTLSSRTSGGGGLGTDFECAGGLQPVEGFAKQRLGEYIGGEVGSTCAARDYKDATDLVVHGTQDPCVSDQARTLGRNSGQENAVFVSLRGREGGATAELGGPIAGTLRAATGGGDKPHVMCEAHPILEPGARTGKSTTDVRAGLGVGSASDPMFTLQAGKQHGVQAGMAVRRLTPVECERLQGFPDNFTKIPYRNKPEGKCPDGPRYKALGNSMAVPVMRWIGERITAVDAVKPDEDAA